MAVAAVVKTTKSQEDLAMPGRPAVAAAMTEAGLEEVLTAESRRLWRSR